LDYLPLRNPGAPGKGLADRARPLLAGRRELDSLDRIRRHLEHAFMAEAVAALTEESGIRKRRPPPVGPRLDVVRMPATSELPAAARVRAALAFAHADLKAKSRRVVLVALLEGDDLRGRGLGLRRDLDPPCFGLDRRSPALTAAVIDDRVRLLRKLLASLRDAPGGIGLKQPAAEVKEGDLGLLRPVLRASRISRSIVPRGGRRQCSSQSSSVSPEATWMRRLRSEKEISPTSKARASRGKSASARETRTKLYVCERP